MHNTKYGDFNKSYWAFIALYIQYVLESRSDTSALAQEDLGKCGDLQHHLAYSK